MDESVFQQIVYQRGGQGWIHVGPDVLFLDDVYLDVKAFVDFLEVFKCLVYNLVDSNFGFSLELVVVDFRQEE